MAAPKPRALSVTQQAIALKRDFPTAALEVKAGKIVWRHALQPTPLSRSYRIQIAYRVGRPPSVRVLDDLESREGEQLPHTFSDGTLCLHEYYDWSGQMWIATTTVPWASEWLAFYELWLPNGDWFGGGQWPPSRSKRD